MTGTTKIFSIEELSQLLPQLGGILRGVNERLQAVEEQIGAEAAKPRKVNTDPDSVVVALYLLHRKNMTISEVAKCLKDVTRSQVQGISSWTYGHVKAYLSVVDTKGLFQQGENHPEFATIAPDYSPTGDA